MGFGDLNNFADRRLGGETLARWKKTHLESGNPPEDGPLRATAAHEWEKDNINAKCDVVRRGERFREYRNRSYCDTLKKMIKL